MGVDSSGETGLDVSTDASDDDEESEEENGLEAELVVVAGNPGMPGLMVGSRTATPNTSLEVGVGIIAPEQVEAGIPSVPPLPSTQQFTEGNYLPAAAVFFTGGAFCPGNAAATHPANTAAISCSNAAA